MYLIKNQASQALSITMQRIAAHVAVARTTYGFALQPFMYNAYQANVHACFRKACHDVDKGCLTECRLNLM